MPPRRFTPPWSVEDNRRGLCHATRTLDEDPNRQFIGLSVIVLSVAASRTPRCASWMIFGATSRVALSSVNFSANFAQTVSSASDISRIRSGSNA
jgi:hypothetical protein